jgi:hypothetical protein
MCPSLFGVGESNGFARWSDYRAGFQGRKPTSNSTAKIDEIMSQALMNDDYDGPEERKAL